MTDGGPTPRPLLSRRSAVLTLSLRPRTLLGPLPRYQADGCGYPPRRQYGLQRNDPRTGRRQRQHAGRTKTRSDPRWTLEPVSVAISDARWPRAGRRISFFPLLWPADGPSGSTSGVPEAACGSPHLFPALMSGIGSKVGGLGLHRLLPGLGPHRGRALVQGGLVWFGVDGVLAD